MSAGRMSRWLAFPAGRRRKWIVLAGALVVLFVAGSFAGKLEGALNNEPVSYLPGNAESVRALQKVRDFPSGRTLSGIVVYGRRSGLTAADRSRVLRDRASLNTDRAPRTGAISPPIFSPNGTTALLVAPLVDPKGKEDRITKPIDEIRRRVGDGSGGLEIRVTGPAGFSADAIKVFADINGTLLLGTAALVFVLLIVIYRSPIFWIVPLLSVVAAEMSSRAVGYGLAEAGVTINGQSSGVLVVLVFGAGTDYALLLVARYREELRRYEDKHEALAVALRRAGPVIIASGLTVIAALLCLSVAQVNGTAGLGPIGAIGVALAMGAMLTALPASLAVVGRRAFWPFIPHFGDAGADETHGVWRRIGERIAMRPRRVWVSGLLVLGVMAVGLVDLNSDLASGNGFRGSVASVQGQKLLERGFPAGAGATTNVVVQDVARLPAVRVALQRQPGVAAVGRVERGAPGAKFDVTLRADPYSPAAFDQITKLRRAAHRAGGPDTLVGGPTAEERDVRVSAVRDNRLIVPIVLLVVFLILAMLLRAVVLPLVLIGTVIASYAAALGVGSFFFEHIFRFMGEDPTLPLFAFVFLVALGIDYNIFLTGRVREEAQRRGTRSGMVRGLAVTGAVITSAGIVLAGTFSVLAILPLVVLTEIGFTIAFGVLLDTFIVRSLIVPALVFEIGPRVWWPSKLAEARHRPLAPDIDRLEEPEPAGVR
jgi:putative drug exporter of the RND superfamily